MLKWPLKKQKNIHSGRTEKLGGAAPAAKVAHVDGKISETRETTSDRATPMAPRKTLEFHLDFVQKNSLNHYRDTSLPVFTCQPREVFFLKLKLEWVWTRESKGVAKTIQFQF